MIENSRTNEPLSDERILNIEDAEQLARLAYQKVKPLLAKCGYNIDEVRIFGSFYKDKVCKRDYGKFMRGWRDELADRENRSPWDQSTEDRTQIEDATIACGGSLSQRGLDAVSINCLKQHLPPRLHIVEKHVYSDIDLYFLISPVDKLPTRPSKEQLRNISEDLWVYSYPHQISIDVWSSDDVHKEILRNSRKVDDIDRFVDREDIVSKSVRRRIEL